MNSKEKQKIKTYIDLNQRLLDQSTERVRESPHNFDAYARMQFYEGVVVGLKMATTAGKD